MLPGKTSYSAPKSVLLAAAEDITLLGEKPGD
jgi:hypothetical protein